MKNLQVYQMLTVIALKADEENADVTYNLTLDLMDVVNKRMTDAEKQAAQEWINESRDNSMTFEITNEED